MGGQLVALHLEEQLRARPDDLEGRRPDEEEIRARVHPAERTIERDPIEPAAVCTDGQVEALATGEHDLDRLTGRDGVLGDLDGADVLVAPEAGPDTGTAEPGAARGARPVAAGQRPDRADSGPGDLRR